jgi:uncharacterized protein (TIGR00255 family)
MLSMTGHGEAHRHDASASIALEVRTVNNRYFKLTVRSSEGYASLEPQIEALVRKHVHRGTVQVSLKIDRQATAEDYRHNQVVLAGYLRQLEAARAPGISAAGIHVEALLALPGVVQEPTAGWETIEAQWPIIEKVLAEALERLTQMRTEEGRAMAADFAANCQHVATQLAAISLRAPLVVEAYRARITERLNKLLEEHGVRIEASDVVREVGIYAERSDISEEIVRLKSHLDQFEQIMANEDNAGRKLDFLTQEMFRETNTIGSKANDAEIARFVIEIKTAIERMREMIQNVE